MLREVTLLELATRLVDAAPGPALIAAPPDRVVHLNAAARSLLGAARPQAGSGLRSLLGIGWLELDNTARDGSADVVLELAAQHDGRNRGRRWRARLETIDGAAGDDSAVVAYLEPAPAREAASHQPGGSPGFGALTGSDPALLATKRAAERFAATPVPILLLAETGTGKELLARAIHAASPRRDQPFVAINCGALSAQLLESELFGYAPGAFTGASREGNEGKIGAARGGTLFLDEIAEMPAPLQALLLRVLEDGTYYRIGESRPRQADVRLICATCRDLPALVASGAFREDLFYRVNGACLGLPPLRRRADLRELLPELLAAVASELGVGPPPALDGDAAERLCSAPWPGNTRQLKSALRYALVLCDGARIRREHLPAELGGGSAEEPPTADHGAESAPNGASAERPQAAPVKTLRQRERERLERAIESSGGNLSRAARELGIARSTLYRRLRRHGFVP